MLRVTVLLLLSVLVPLYAQESQVLPAQSLDEMVAHSGRIVQGHVVSARIEPHPKFSNLNTVLVTFRVEDSLKGQAADTLQFRQYIWAPVATASATGYVKGEELLLFLRPVSAYGLTSPVGMQAGRFRIQQQANGKVAINGNGNAGLFRSTQQPSQASTAAKTQSAAGATRTTAEGPIALEDLKASIRAAMKGN